MRAVWLLLCVLPLPAGAAPLLRQEGVATTADGLLAYREVHWQRGLGEGGERWVQYLCPDGRPFARKQVPASARPQVRGYRLQDRRSGHQASVAVADRSIRIAWQEQPGSADRAVVLPLPDDAVVDIGFDAAVRTHWSVLMQGQAVILPFLVPPRGRFYPIHVQRVRTLRWQGQPAQSIEVRLDAWYGALAPRLTLVYAEADHRLLEFHGTSNLRDAHGRYPQVVVRFAAPAVERPAQQWEQELQQPLVARCDVTGR